MKLSAVDALLRLGQPEEITALASKGWGPNPRPKVNTHIHLPPNFSAFQSVGEAIDAAAREEIGVLGAGNYYDFEVYSDFAQAAGRARIFPLFGLEIVCRLEDLARRGIRVNDPGNPGKIYFCGKAITRFEQMSAEARDLMTLIRSGDSQRMAEMIRRLMAVFSSHGVDTGLDEAAVIDGVVRRHGCPRSWVTLQERHIAQAFQEAFFVRVVESRRAAILGDILSTPSRGMPGDAVAIQGEIRKHLMKAGKRAFVEERFVTFEQGRRLILALGGIPCYPVLADGAEPVCEYEQNVDNLTASIKAAGVHAAEFIPARNKPDVLVRYVAAMRGAGLVVTAGTEHNTLDALAMEPACAGGCPVPEEIREVFWEGACVQAAHQFLTLHGRAGFVDAEGNLDSDFGTDNRRIEAFRALGAAVIRKFQESCAR